MEMTCKWLDLEPQTEEIPHDSRTKKLIDCLSEDPEDHPDGFISTIERHNAGLKKAHLLHEATSDIIQQKSCTIFSKNTSLSELDNSKFLHVFDPHAISWRWPWRFAWRASWWHSELLCAPLCAPVSILHCFSWPVERSHCCPRRIRPAPRAFRQRLHSDIIQDSSYQRRFQVSEIIRGNSFSAYQLLWKQMEILRMILPLASRTRVV